MKALRLSLVGLLVVPALLTAQQGRRCVGELVHADNDWRRVEQFGANVTNYFGGHVQFRCQRQPVRVGADSVQVVNENIYMLMGHAFYRDSSIEVLADTLTYFLHSPNPGQDEMVQARLNVRITDRATGSTLTGPSVDFFRAVRGVRDSDDVQAIGRPTVRYLADKIVKGRVAPKPWTITADHLRGFGQSRLWGGGTVVIVRDSFRLTSDSLDVESGKSRLGKFLGTPALLRRVGADFFRLKGKEIRLSFTGDTLKVVRAAGDGEVLRDNGTVRGESIVLALVDESPVRTDAWGKDVKASVHSGGYDADGDSLVIETPASRLQGLRIYGRGSLVNPIDTLHPVVIDSASGGNPDRDTLWGNRIVASFEERDSSGTKVNRVSRIVAAGSARSSYAYNAGHEGQNCPTLTYFQADTIRVRMRGADSTGVADVQYIGGVHGMILEKATNGAVPSDSTKAAPSCRGAKQ